MQRGKKGKLALHCHLRPLVSLVVPGFNHEAAVHQSMDQASAKSGNAWLSPGQFFRCSNYYYYAMMTHVKVIHRVKNRKCGEYNYSPMSPSFSDVNIWIDHRTIIGARQLYWDFRCGQRGCVTFVFVSVCICIVENKIFFFFFFCSRSKGRQLKQDWSQKSRRSVRPFASAKNYRRMGEISQIFPNFWNCPMRVTLVVII